MNPLTSGDPVASLTHLLLIVVSTILILLFLTILVIIFFWLLSFHSGHIRKSTRLRRNLTIFPKNDDSKQATTEQHANSAVRRSYVIYEDNQVKLYVPTKPFWQLSSNLKVQKMIREAIESQDFRDFLETEFPDYYFSSPRNRGKYFLIVGEK